LTAKSVNYKKLFLFLIFYGKIKIIKDLGG